MDVKADSAVKRFGLEERGDGLFCSADNTGEMVRKST